MRLFLQHFARRLGLRLRLSALRFGLRLGLGGGLRLKAEGLSLRRGLFGFRYCASFLFLRLGHFFLLLRHCSLHLHIASLLKASNIENDRLVIRMMVRVEIRRLE